ncbi:hypothetical protein ACFOSC_32995 [Streptantibioticus rubrisoli]|uniref:Uncharacterized protein n=1 Tax=Streptantibioticus rubrisoli TaxID=1387313 RepID=A0ABT1PHA9_9ACTN|nr:hypothetical protein [Streptantibioticus rubrisoli]MCQ4044753.1 hypothetical protein [Streptantibioticus rubrisoli]
MPRSMPSKADRELVAAVSVAGVAVSAAQLERWRQWDLLPQATRTWQGRYGSACSLPEGSVELATALGRRARRGRGWADLAVLAWMDGAPVKPSVLARAMRHSTRTLLETVLAELEQEMAASPVPEDLRLDPAFERAEAMVRIIDGQRHSGRRVTQRMRARLRAAGCEVPDNPLNEMLIRMWSAFAEPPDDETAQMGAVALGLASESPDEMAVMAGFGWLFGRGLIELSGTSGHGLVDLAVQQLLNGEAMVTTEEMTRAREEFRSVVVAIVPDGMGVGPSQDAMLAQLVALFSSVWALVCRQLPDGGGLPMVLRVGLDAIGVSVPAHEGLRAALAA